MLLLGSLGTIKNLSIFKDLSLDDWLDQMNRTFMFLLLCFMGTIVAVSQYTGELFLETCLAELVGVIRLVLGWYHYKKHTDIYAIFAIMFVSNPFVVTVLTVPFSQVRTYPATDSRSLVMTSHRIIAGHRDSIPSRKLTIFRSHRSLTLVSSRKTCLLVGNTSSKTGVCIINCSGFPCDLSFESIWRLKIISFIIYFEMIIIFIHL